MSRTTGGGELRTVDDLDTVGLIVTVSVADECDHVVVLPLEGRNETASNEPTRPGHEYAHTDRKGGRVLIPVGGGADSRYPKRSQLSVLYGGDVRVGTTAIQR